MKEEKTYRSKTLLEVMEELQSQPFEPLVRSNELDQIDDVLQQIRQYRSKRLKRNQ